MTSFGSFFKALFYNRFRDMNFIILINIIAIAVQVIWTAIDGNYSTGTYLQAVMSWSFIVYVIAFARLAVMQERIYTRDSYRFIPIGDIQFYLANFLSSLVSMLYVFLIEFVFYFFAGLANWDNIKETLNMVSMMNGQANFDMSQLYRIGLYIFLIMLAYIILFWMTINLIHLLSKVGSNFLPSVGRNILNVVVYIVVIYLVLRVVSYMMNFFSNTIQTLSTTNDLGGLLLNLSGFILVAIIEAVANIYLLHNWVETVSES